MSMYLKILSKNYILAKRVQNPNESLGVYNVFRAHYEMQFTRDWSASNYSNASQLFLPFHGWERSKQAR